jgi:phage terminase small subunit
VVSVEKKLTDKQQRFVEEYMIDFNATQAAIRAGYSEKTARKIGQENLTKPDIQEEIQKRKNKLTEKSEINAQWVLDNFVELSQRCMQKVPVMEKVDGELIPTGEWKFDSTGANKALENVGKMIGVYIEKTENRNYNENVDLSKLTDEQLIERTKKLLKDMDKRGKR